MEKPFSTVAAPTRYMPLPGLQWGVGDVMQRRLASNGIAAIGPLATRGERERAARYGRIGARMARVARGEDRRRVDPRSPLRSISAGTTLAHYKADVVALVRMRNLVSAPRLRCSQQGRRHDPFWLIGVRLDASWRTSGPIRPALFDCELYRPRRRERAMDQTRTRLGD